MPSLQQSYTQKQLLKTDSLLLNSQPLVSLEFLAPLLWITSIYSLRFCALSHLLVQQPQIIKSEVSSSEEKNMLPFNN